MAENGLAVDYQGLSIIFYLPFWPFWGWKVDKFTLFVFLVADHVVSLSLEAGAV